MLDDHAPLLQTIVTALNGWQSTAEGADCTIRQINITLPDNTDALFFWLESQEKWDIVTQSTNSAGVTT